MTLFSPADRPWLAPFGALYGALSAGRRAAYERGLRPRSRLQGPVISVGNLAVGGRGKTPLVAWIGARLHASGLPLAVLSRGHGGAYAEDVLVVSDGTTVAASATEAGDEPVLLAQALPGVVVAVGRRRDDVGRGVEARFGPRVHLLDDGFQHLRLHRDLDVVCLGPRDLEARLLPAGPLREPVAALSRAHLVCVPDLATAERVRGRFPAAEAVVVTRRRDGFVDGYGRPRVAPPRAVLLSGIADPAAFRADVAAEGVAVTAERVYPDHHAFTAGELGEVDALARATGADAIVTTAKDAVRVPGGAVSTPLAVLRLALEVEDEAAFLARLLAVARGEVA